MDHNEAVRLHAAEKYLLGEFSPAQRDEYEEHYFTCEICAEDLKASAAFMDGARQVLREGNLEKAGVKSRVEAGPGWFAWLRPAFAVPVFAALLLFVGYQNAITIPGLRHASPRQATVKVVQYKFLPEGSRGESTETIRVRRDEDYELDVDLPGTNAGVGYLGQIQDAAGHVLASFAVSTDKTDSMVHVDVPAGTLPAGKYDLIILAGQAPAASTGQQKVAARVGFSVEFLP